MSATEINNLCISTLDTNNIITIKKHRKTQALCYYQADSI